MWDLIQERTVSYDPDNAYSINYLWGTTGLGYNEDKIKALIPDAPLDTWKLIFDPQYASKLAECGIYVLDAPTEVIPAALNYLGLDPNVITKETLKKAEAAIEPIRPYIRKFHSSEYISALANGDICLALGWSGDILQASDRAKEADKGVVVKYTIPKEGTQMWFDQMAIPADAKNKAEAYKFMNYIMQPEVIAKVSNYVSYANGNKASQAFIEKDILENPSVFPNKETLERLFTVKTWNAKEQRWANRTWTKIKSGR
ncbi:MAG: spermidine/putrescine ABC transporter substrate-binding protein PotF [Proteobacteria bacterium]|nr:MAG: spermidine/putrescine ABC transporter substrate-binding protein PotF [Pseudomonadota bacterium]